MLDAENKQKLKWGVGLFASAMLLAIFFATALTQNHSINIELTNVVWETLGMPNEGNIILSECAKTACVATKAADLAAKVEAEHQAQITAQIQIAAESSFDQNSLVSSASINHPPSSVSSESVPQQPRPEPVLAPPLMCLDGTSGSFNQCEGHGGVCHGGWSIQYGCRG
jgi:hypothetical protein